MCRRRRFKLPRPAALLALALAEQVMNRQVGKGIDDPDAYPVFYRLRYAAGRNERWSSEGSESDGALTRRP